MKKRKNRPAPASPTATSEAPVAGMSAVEPAGDSVLTSAGMVTDAPPSEAAAPEPAAPSVPPTMADGALPEPGDDDVTGRMELGSAFLAVSEATVQDPVESVDPAAFTEYAAAAEMFGLTGDPPAGDEGHLGDQPGPAGEDADALPSVEGPRLQSIIESLLFAADRPLVVGELKRLLGERDGKRIGEALEQLRARHADSGIQLVSVAGGWQLRTHPGNGAWVAKLVAGRPTRLSRAMMETLAIVAYRQPITRPEIDEIRGVDCGPVLRTLLDRSLIRVIGKKEEVGRPILYGTTPEFLKIFSLRDLADLPTLREFHELGADDRAKVDATAGADAASAFEGVHPGAADLGGQALRSGALPDVDGEEEDALIEALEHATHAAGQAERALTEPQAGIADDPDAEATAAAAQLSETADGGDR